MAEIHAKHIDEQSVDTLIQDDVSFSGEATVNKNVAIKGSFTGSLNSDDNVYIDKNAIIEADIKSLGSVYIRGSVKGNIDAMHRVELFSNCTLTGNVITERMVIESYCDFNGACTMRKTNNDLAEEIDDDTE